MFRNSLLFLLLAAVVLSADPPSEFGSRNSRYILQPSDVLEVRYRYTPEFNQSVIIQPDGFVSLTLAGDLKIADITLDAAKALLLAKSAVRLKDPEISLVLKEFERAHFVVAGEVSSPGRFDLKGSISTLEAVAMAGGLKNSAKHSQAILYRRVGSDLASATIVDLKRIATVSGFKEDMQLRAGDVLFIPQNRISKVERFVRWGSWGVYI
jgi:polysaccharide biosynthesis/export protein